MSFFKDLFKPANLLTALKSMVLSIIFAVLWVIWSLIGAAIALSAPKVALIVMIVFLVIGLFIWGWLARKLWGWK